MKDKISFNSICEFFIQLYIIIIMISSNTGATAVKGIRLVLVFILVINIIREKKIKFSWYGKWAALFLLLNVFLIKYAYDRDIAVSYTLSLTYVVIANLLICQYLLNHKSYDKIFNAIIYGSVIKGLFVFCSYGPLVFLNTRSSANGSANTIGIYSSISFALCFYHLKTKDNNNGKTKYIVLSIMSVIFALLSASRKSIIFLLVPIIIYYIVKSKNPMKSIFNIFIVTGIVGLSLFALYNIPFLYDLIGKRLESMIQGFLGNDTDASTSTRLYLIQDGIYWFKQKVLFGYGPANYRALHAHYYRGLLLYAHNNYIELLVDIGIVGTVLYYVLYIKTIILSLVSSLKINRNYFIFLGIIVSILIAEYGFVTYDEPIIQLILMTMLLLFESVYGKKGQNEKEKCY